MDYDDEVLYCYEIQVSARMGGESVTMAGK